MRFFARRTLILTACAATGALWSGCSAKKVTEYVPGVSTQVTVPRDLKAIRVEVSIGGVSQFCQGYRVYDNKVLLPRSLGNFANSDATITSGPVSYTISGLTTNDLDADFFATCKTPAVGSDDVRVLRRSRQPFIQDQTLFLPMPLKYSCYDKDCPAVGGVEQTCKGGKCVDASLTDDQVKALPAYSPDLVDGTGGNCFHSQLCMSGSGVVNGDSGAVPLPSAAIQVDPDKCIYAVAGSASVPASLPIDGGVPATGGQGGDGVNVQVTFDGGLVREILDLDPVEGFTTPDPAHPQRFQLAPGLCEMVHGLDEQSKPTPHRITAVRASGTCQAKLPTQPLCAADQLAAMGLDPNGVSTNPVGACSTQELKPPQSGLIVVVDDSTEHQAFFTSIKNNTTVVTDTTDQDALVSVAVKAALSDPAFERTQIGLVYGPGTNAANTCSTTGPADKALALASVARDPILSDLASHTPTAPTPTLGPALDRAYAALRAPANAGFFRRAVLVLANGGFDTDGTCDTTLNPITVATAANTPDPTTNVRTYVMQLTKNPPKPAANWSADHLAVAGGSATEDASHVITNGAAYQSQEGTAEFEQIVNYLATCVYDTTDDAAAPKAGDTLAFVDPLVDTHTTLSFNAACNAPDAGSGAGWGFSTIAPVAPATTGTRRVYLCPDSCAAYRNVLDQTTKFSALYQQPAQPVPVFAYRSPDPTTGVCP